jgi:hypothetical protein
MRRQLAAMPNELYLVRLIHAVTKSCGPGERLWTASLLTHGATVRFLRARNRDGFDVYLYPYADRGNSGYILVDLDGPQPQIIPTLRAQGHEPCVVVQTSPGHLQAWIRVSTEPLHPAVASAIGRHLARTYGGDPASTDWRHLGRLAGFTNQKPQRRMDGYAPWVILLHAKVGLATHGASLVEAAVPQLPHPCPHRILAASASDHAAGLEAPDPFLTVSAATAIYRAWLQRLRIPQRFPQPDWSIADLWIAKELLACGTPYAQVQTILQLGSPRFPRRHSHPDDYLRRTLARAMRELAAPPFPARASLPRRGYAELVDATHLAFP